jgi:hypothetical protein
MKILFDQNVPRPLWRYLTGHLVSTAYAMGWDRAVNGELLQIAVAAGFDVFITGDRNLSYQQNLGERKIIVELTRNNWPCVKPHVDEIAAAVNSCIPGSYTRVTCGS